jgi:hypothetical protein
MRAQHAIHCPPLGDTLGGLLILGTRYADLPDMDTAHAFSQSRESTGPNRSLDVGVAFGRTLAHLALSLDDHDERARLSGEMKELYDAMRERASQLVMTDQERMRVARVLLELEDTLTLLEAEER